MLDASRSVTVGRQPAERRTESRVLKRHTKRIPATEEDFENKNRPNSSSLYAEAQQNGYKINTKKGYQPTAPRFTGARQFAGYDLSRY